MITSINEFRKYNENMFSGKFSSLIKTFTEPTYPAQPFKREFTEAESTAMRTNFPQFSWSNIDANGIIVLGGGKESRGLYYITEDDLLSLVNK